MDFNTVSKTLKEAKLNMKVYTKTGDKGKTSLLGGKRIAKDDMQIEAYGTVDELNSHVGNIINYTDNKEIKEQIIHIQRILFNIGAKLASDTENKKINIEFNEEEITLLEKQMDKWEKELPPLKGFILPSGSSSISASHIARTVCRRAERRIVSVNQKKDEYDTTIRYINRLSDYLFVLSRKFGLDENVKDSFL